MTNQSTPILVIEDERTWGHLLVEIIQETGLETRCATTYEEALAELQSGTFVAATVDLKLSISAPSEGLEGLALLDVTVERDIPVIIVTAHGTHDVVNAAYQRYNVAKVLDKADFEEQEFKKLLKETVGNTYEEYNVAAVRNLIRNAFMEVEVRRFLRDRPQFRPILDYCGTSCSLEEIVDKIVEYCHKRLLFPDLISEIRQHNPKQYERYQSHIMQNNPAFSEQSSR